jgi:aryl-alcohol dehydrogenase-like predicted oxidoreductase
MILATNPLGTSEMLITSVGFGAWAISGSGWSFAWGSQDDADSIATIHRAVEAGVNWIDTAASYGLGHSEVIVGRALAGLPAADRPLVFTKCGLVWDEADPSIPARRILTPTSVRRELDASLRRLRVERIDLYQVHWPPTGRPLAWGSDEPQEQVQETPIEEYWQVMADLRAEGKIRALGLSNHRVDHLERAEAVAHVDVLQPPFSLVERGSVDELAWCADHGTGVIVYSPLHSGLLTGAFSPERVAALPDDDWRKTSPDFTTRLAPILALVDALRPIAARHEVPVPAVAVAWTQAWRGVTGAIVGARRPDQLPGWLPAAELRLTEVDLDDIASALKETGVGAGPTRPPAAGPGTP